MTVLAHARVIAIVRLTEPGPVIRIGHELADAGLTALEVTITTPGALDAIATLRAALADRCAVGAGSVRTVQDTAAAAASGAQFLVTPTTRVEVLAQAQRDGLPVVCGAFTPTEVDTAWSAGASLIKLFPASHAGPAYVRELRGPMPDVPLVPTGGVTADSLDEWAAAGAVAVGAGGALLKAAEIGAGDWPALRRRVRDFMAAVHAAPWDSRGT